ncbi:DHA2 family multidrug resistance protein [Acinetobacter calcoaceticus]|uniref:DHA2 family multidrug resistance protein n=1 Tax=Acinetobacter calcoaceticus TaxID=471 RepID=A0A4R1XYT2_ACICA|nr:DHA2 family multidrug resistance protein [Acinetobacter calcoaceticus]
MSTMGTTASSAMSPPPAQVVFDPVPQPAPAAPPPAPVFGPRLALGLFGILLAAMIAGLNNRVPGLALADIQGALGFSRDQAAWLNTVYSAGELAAMPFASWFAITYSMRRFQMWMLSSALFFSALLPWVHNYELMLLLRSVQGLCSGALIPILMMAALRFLPAPIRLHGLALYALTATFSPNVALWLSSLFVDSVQDWRWIYWHTLPLGAVSLACMAYGVPKSPMLLGRFKQCNWLAILIGVLGLACLVVTLDQGLRLDWLNSPRIQASAFVGVSLTGLFLLMQWKDPAPFIRLQLLGKRNLGLGFSVFFVMLIVMSSAVVLPVNTLAQLHGLRLEQTAQIGLMVGVPQLILGSLVALLLYRKWIDARYLFALGLSCMAAACWMGTKITSDWMLDEFLIITLLQSIGQPLAVVSMLFLGTSVVQPMEGPYVSGIINTLRALGTVVGSAVVGQFLFERNQMHRQHLIDQASHLAHAGQIPVSELSLVIHQQALVLATADIYRVFAVVAVLLIPLVLMLQYVPAPQVKVMPDAQATKSA